MPPPKSIQRERDVQYRRGMTLKNKITGKLFVLRNRATGNKHWNISAMKGATNHRVHEGTLAKFYEVAT